MLLLCDSLIADMSCSDELRFFWMLLQPAATLKVVANVDAVDSDPLGLSPSMAYSSRSTSISGSMDASSDSGSNRSNTDSYRSEGSRFVKNFINGWGRGSQTMVEGPTSRLVTKHIFFQNDGGSGRSSIL